MSKGSKIIVVDATNADSPNAFVPSTSLSASQEIEARVCVTGLGMSASAEGPLGFIRRAASQYLAAVVIGATEPTPMIPTCTVERVVVMRPRFGLWHQVLAGLKPAHLSTPRGMVSPSERAIPPKLRTFALSDRDVLSWRHGGK